MRVTVAGVELCSPVIAASGTFGYGVEFEEIVSLDRIGAFVTKGLSREPMAGNPAPRIVETAAGMMNAIGLQNMGVRAFVEEKLPKLREMAGAVVIANVFGFNVEDCLAVIEVLNDAPGIAMYELNASCPNTAHGGMVFGTDAKALEELVRGGEDFGAAAGGEAVAECDIDRADGEGGGGGGRAGVVAGQYVSVDGDRCGDAAAADCECDGGAIGAGDQADRGADGVRGGEGGEDSDRGDGRDRAGGGCGGVPAGGRDGGAGGDGKLCGSAGGGEHCERAEEVVRGARGGGGAELTGALLV